jgi:hypothetical protein
MVSVLKMALSPTGRKMLAQKLEYLATRTERALVVECA